MICSWPEKVLLIKARCCNLLTGGVEVLLLPPQ